LRTELEETFQSRRGVLWPLAFIAMGQQQQSEAAKPGPLVLATGDELVNDNLGAVDKIAELSLPDRQRCRCRRRIPVFERQRRFLGQQGVIDLKTRLVFPDMFKRNVFRTIFLVMQH